MLKEGDPNHQEVFQKSAGCKGGFTWDQETGGWSLEWERARPVLGVQYESAKQLGPGVQPGRGARWSD